VVEVQFPKEAYPETGENWVVTRPGHTQEWQDRIRQRRQSAERDTTMAAKENARGDRQRKGLYKEWTEYEDQPAGDDRIYLKKTLSQAQVVYGHLETLTSQLRPLVKCQPRPKQIYAAKEASGRAALKEILINNQFDISRFESDTLPSWRWNFLFHTSAYVRTLYRTSRMDADIEFKVVDRSNLYVDPDVDTGNIRDAGVGD
jgi:hypothetical protein